MLWPIPQEEIQANDGISDAQNNQMGTLPVSDPVSTAIAKSGVMDSYSLPGLEKSTSGFSKATR